MLAEILAGSYERYKKDTDAFTTWLSETAAACGYTPPLARTQHPSTSPSRTPTSNSPGDVLTLAKRLRAQAEKKAKKREAKKAPESSNSAIEPTNIPIVKHTVSTQDILRQAKAIANNAKIGIPNSMVYIVDRAIQARKRCAAWFQKSGIENGHSAEGNLHFVEILEQSLRILKPESDLKQRPAQKAGVDEEKHPDLDGLNRFSELVVEDVEDIVDDLIVLRENKTTAGKNQAVVVYELETDNSVDRVFDVFCFFEDLHCIQQFLKDTWTKYHLGELDLLTAAIVTDAALDIARREELKSRNSFHTTQKTT